MNDLVTFSFRLPRQLAAEFETAASRLGLSRSDYARRALEHFQEQAMQQRMADLSRQLAREGAEAARSMDDAESDGLG